METKVKVNTLKRLYDLGQSPWYDNIDRRLIASGGLKQIIENGIMGLTSNPTIFEKAVAASDIYNKQIEMLAKRRMSPKEIYDEITISDVRDAADLLKDIYIKSGRIDGYVSIEVYPEYAHSAKDTISYAKMLFNKIKRENIMIKVPGTKGGCEAVRALVRDGINVNVTLLFSLAHYERAASAYIDGLRDRIKDGRIVKGIASVASVFISRIDTWIDKMLDEKKDPLLRGKAAVANTKLIYQRFKELFGYKNFGDLRRKGAFVQRPLWASTSTKDPSYSDVKYVDELIGRDTINTIPHTAMDAFLDHGRPSLTIEKDVSGAQDILRNLSGLGIDITSACQAIQDDGVKAFQASFDKLIAAITGCSKKA